MVSRSFRGVFALRVVLLTATLALLVLLLADGHLVATTALVAVAAAVQVRSLVALVETTNRVTERFLSAVAATDHSESFTTGLTGKTFDELNVALRDLTRRFRDVTLEKEATLRFLRAVVRQVEVGLVAYGEDGRVELINEAAWRLLGICDAEHVSDFRTGDAELAARFERLEPGRRELVKLQRDHEVLQLSLRATQLRLREKTITLVTVQNIALELDEKEMEAWQNLVRVFTHEIKNSLTPIASLSATVEDLLLTRDGAPRSLSDDEALDVREALRTIARRSQGLLGFLDTYRDLTHVPQPELTTFAVTDLLHRAEQLVAERLRRGAVALETSVEPEDLRLSADPRLAEQVLLNLLLNAVEALEGRSDGKVTVTAGQDPRGRVVIRVSDNGPGIVEEVREKVFVPFFSTRREGTGIGLCLSRQIMRKHRGELMLSSVPGEDTTFVMRF